MCCKLLGVEELKKHPNVWCGHVQKRKGCGIYADRPQNCKDFTCLWALDDRFLHENLRPDLTHVVFVAYESHEPNNPANVVRGVSLYVDPNHPRAHLLPPVSTYVDSAVANKLPVIALIGDRAFTRLGKNWIECKVVRHGSEYSGGIDVYQPLTAEEGPPQVPLVTVKPHHYVRVRKGKDGSYEPA
jgi:hypothetical protein